MIYKFKDEPIRKFYVNIFLKYRKKCCKYFYPFTSFYIIVLALIKNICLQFFPRLDYKGYLLHVCTFQNKCKYSEYYEIILEEHPVLQ